MSASRVVPIMAPSGQALSVEIREFLSLKITDRCMNGASTVATVATTIPSDQVRTFRKLRVADLVSVRVLARHRETHS